MLFRTICCCDITNFVFFRRDVIITIVYRNVTIQRIDNNNVVCPISIRDSLFLLLVRIWSSQSVVLKKLFRLAQSVFSNRYNEYIPIQRFAIIFINFHVKSPDPIMLVYHRPLHPPRLFSPTVCQSPIFLCPLMNFPLLSSRFFLTIQGTGRSSDGTTSNRRSGSERHTLSNGGTDTQEHATATGLLWCGNRRQRRSTSPNRWCCATLRSCGTTAASESTTTTTRTLYWKKRQRS